MMLRHARLGLVLGGPVLAVLLLSGCPSTKDAPDRAPTPDEATPPKDEPDVAIPEPVIPAGVNHLQNPKWVEGPNPTEIPEVDSIFGSEAYGKVASERERALARACAANASKVVRIDPARSRVGFVSYKNETLRVPGMIKEIHGYALVGDTAHLSFWSNALTIKTGDKGRDARLSKIFFQNEGGGHAVLTFTAHAIEGLDGPLPTEEGASVELSVSGELTLHGKTQKLTVPLTLTREGDHWKLNQRGTVLIPFEPFNLIGPLKALLAACNHKSIGTSVSLDLDLTLLQGC